MRFLFFVVIFRFSFPCRPPGLRRCLSNRCLECPRLQGRLLDHCVKFSRRAGGGGIDVRCLSGVWPTALDTVGIEDPGFVRAV